MVKARSDNGVGGDFGGVGGNCEVRNKEKEALLKMNDRIIGETYFKLVKKRLENR
jgi:hypothetical protein